MIQVKVLVSQRKHRESGTSGKGRNCNSDATQQMWKESGSSGGTEWYEGNEVRQFGMKVRRAAKLRSEVKFNGRGEVKIQYERSVQGESD